jgi:hypothetical protein
MKKYSGILLIVLGALLLVISYFTELVDYNWYNFLSFFVIVAGIITHIVVTKKS